MWMRVGGRNDSEFVIGREEGVLIAVVVGINNGKTPVVGSTRVMPTFKDGGASLVVCLDIMLGKDERLGWHCRGGKFQPGFW